ncbi:cilia- and flagella-associated protein 276 [Triplophysa dalaica]|uniref:cilia- and flagella-associated protein 276 n=1 Tax=Triplophysa dalaica TaxID=1582913 RepID=UPI0024E013DC|nr:cilia- and flagella-associated protein 276 [Triplophysa dalaica]
MPRERDPFPFPRYENDYTLTGSKQIQIMAYDKPTHLAQNDDPWRRLYSASTMSSSRRNIFHCDTTASQDSLDIHLKSIYDHHLGLFPKKNLTVTQKETVSDDHGNGDYLPNQTFKRNSEAPVCEPSNKGIKVWIDGQRVSMHSIKGTIESHHAASTNRGYSRKHDGGFYST